MTKVSYAMTRILSASLSSSSNIWCTCKPNKCLTYHLRVHLQTKQVSNMNFKLIIGLSASRGYPFHLNLPWLHRSPLSHVTKIKLIVMSVYYKSPQLIQSSLDMAKVSYAIFFFFVSIITNKLSFLSYLMISRKAALLEDKILSDWSLSKSPLL